MVLLTLYCFDCCLWLICSGFGNFSLVWLFDRQFRVLWVSVLGWLCLGVGFLGFGALVFDSAYSCSGLKFGGLVFWILFGCLGLPLVFGLL